MLAVALHAVALLEAIHTSAGVNQLLLASVERMALGADINAHFLLDGTGLESFAANATNDTLAVIGMDIFLHGFHLTLIGLSILRREPHPINHTSHIIAQCSRFSNSFCQFLHGLCVKNPFIIQEDLAWEYFSDSRAFCRECG